MPFISTSHKRVILIVFTPCAVCTQRRINHCANCAMAWPHGGPRRQGLSPRLDAFWRRRWRMVLRQHYAMLCNMFCWVYCTRWENVLNASFTVHNDLTKRQRIIWGPGRQRGLAWASHQHSPVMYAGLLLFGGKCSGGKIFPSRRRYVSGNISTYQIHKYATK